MRLASFLSLFVTDTQILHIECVGSEVDSDGNPLYFDGTKQELEYVISDSMLDLWVNSIEAIDDILYIMVSY